jgi:thymidylate synthase (FAD)
MLKQPDVTLLYSTPDAEAKIIAHARVCTRSQHKSTPESDLKVLTDCVRKDHSVIEHCHASFQIICSRACSHELVRYRLASISQESQRWTKPNETEAFLMPESIGKLPEHHQEVYRRFMSESLAKYEYFLDCGVKKEDARYVLPNAALTTLDMTCNFREWRHILKQRLPKHVLPETRRAVEQIRDHLLVVAPVVFDEFKEPKGD